MANGAIGVDPTPSTTLMKDSERLHSFKNWPACALTLVGQGIID
jgi:hypothetical protein